MLKPTHISVHIHFSKSIGFTTIELSDNPLIIGADNKDDLKIHMESHLNFSTLDTSNFPTIYIDKSCKIPRAKLGSLKDNKTLQVKRDIQKADYLVINKDSYIDGMIEYNWNTEVLYLDELHNWLKLDLQYRKSYSEEEKETIKSEFAKIVELCKAHSITKLMVRMDYELRRTIFEPTSVSRATYFNYLNDAPAPSTVNLATNPARKIDEDGDAIPVDLRNYIELNDEKLNVLVYALQNNIKIINSSEVTKLINVTVIDKELFDSLNNMLQSKDETNHNTALEIIASCDFEESLFYIVLLLNLNYQNVSYSDYFKHVNFQAVVQFVRTKLNRGTMETPHRFRCAMGGQAAVENDSKFLLGSGYMFSEHKWIIEKYMFPEHEIKCDFIDTEFLIAKSVLEQIEVNDKRKEENEL
jgi:hypothetical protein